LIRQYADQRTGVTTPGVLAVRWLTYWLQSLFYNRPKQVGLFRMAT
jgi:hypothetical protein